MSVPILYAADKKSKSFPKKIHKEPSFIFCCFPAKNNKHRLGCDRDDQHLTAVKDAHMERVCPESAADKRRMSPLIKPSEAVVREQFKLR